ncbi:MAG: hypothetical protein HY399_05395, partial [Elusimicrobia bacterium]|nr:hypothetical protein [Elusimicrobiota bacterium]
WTVRFRRPDVKEFSFSINLHITQQARDRIIRKEWEEEWYPWRKNSVTDR